jgi:hypothetical protein
MATSSRSMIKLSETVRNAMLDELSRMMDGGSIELLTHDGKILAVLNLSDPATDSAVDGELVFNEIEEEDATRAQGSAFEARIIAADGSEVLSCDVGDESSDAVVKLNSTRIERGGTLELRSFRLVMP